MRELENLVKRIVVLESEEFVLTSCQGARRQQRACVGDGHRRNGAAAEKPVTTALSRSRRRPLPRLQRPVEAWNGLGLKDVARRAAREAEHDVIKQVLEEVRWNRMEAARRLKISYKALLYKIQECGL